MYIDINLIKKLRNKSGVGISDCKKALEENNKNVKDAIIWLRNKNLIHADKKSFRETNKGLIAINIDDDHATIIELSCETDFTSKNEKFLTLTNKILKKVHEFDGDNLQKFINSSKFKTDSVRQIIVDHIAIFGEKITLKRIDKLRVKNGKIISYMHNKVSNNIGKIGVLLALEGNINYEIEKFGKHLGMHIAALNPMSLNIESLDYKFLDKEKNTFRNQAIENKKPINVIEKIVEGKMKKLYESIVLLEQTFVIDGKTKIKNVIQNLRLKQKCNFNVLKYLRYQVGT